MNVFSKALAALTLAGIFAAPVLAQTPPPAAPAAKSTAVKGYTRTTKSGKKIVVKGYNRKVTTTTPAPGKAVKGYTKTLKSGKKVTVKGYTRKATAPKPAAPHM